MTSPLLEELVWHNGSSGHVNANRASHFSNYADKVYGLKSFLRGVNDGCH